MKHESLLETKGLECHFGGLTAVSDLDMKIEAGKITALIGPNGAGKSTTINLLCGFEKPTAGRVLLRGEDVTGHASHRMVRAGMVRTFQSGRLFKRLSVFENALIGNSSKMTSRVFEVVKRGARFRTEERQLERRVHELLDEFGMRDDADRMVTELPYGKQRQVEMVRALAGSPDLLLLDEPAAGLNSAERDNLTIYLDKLRERGLTMLLVEHHMGMVMKVADHVVVLNFGSKIFEGTTVETQQSPIVTEAYLGRRSHHA